MGVRGIVGIRGEAEVGRVVWRGGGGRGEIETVREDRDSFLSDEAHGQQLSTSGGDVDIFLHIELIFNILDPR